MLKAFQQKFTNCPQRTSSGRATAPMKDPTDQQRAVTALLGCFPYDLLKNMHSSDAFKADHPEILKLLEPALSAMAADSQYGGVENFFMSKMRLTLQGTVNVVMLRADNYTAWCGKHGEAANSKGVNIETAFKKMAAMTTAEVADFIKDHPGSIKQATIGKGDCVYVPIGWILMEHAKPGIDMTCVKMSVLHFLQGDGLSFATKAMELLISSMEGMSKNVDLVKEVYEFIKQNPEPTAEMKDEPKP
eukprot:217215-Pyramimonas_sp.AAC.1